MNQILDVKFDPSTFNAIVEVTLTCPDCHSRGNPSNPQFKCRDSAWTENEKCVVVPVECPQCGLLSIIHFIKV